MCGGRRQPPPAPPQMAPAPVLRTPPPVRDIPKPEEIKEATEDPNIITGQRRDRLTAEMIRQGTNVFDAINPGTNPGTPTQGIPSINP